jgi:hypothetical protein
METMQDLNKRAFDYHKRNADWGGSCEFDTEINDISRLKIRAASEIWPEVWLGRVNIYKEHEKKPILKKYEGEKVYNFEYTFAVPNNDEELTRLITDRKNAEYTGTADDYKRVDAIFNRIEALNGINLSWA